MGLALNRAQDLVERAKNLEEKNGVDLGRGEDSDEEFEEQKREKKVGSIEIHMKK